MPSNARGLVYFNISFKDNDPHLQLKRAILENEGILL